jgi:tRNA pseudouridine13 synthase
MLELPYLTAGVPGCGGVLKERPEDFVVEEVPAYPPSGEGEHLFLWVEKKGRSTPEVAKALAVHFGVPEREVSYAGLKDRQAITRQLFSLPAKYEAAAASFSDAEVKLLWWKRHKNKLKSGHLRGNRFELRLRRVRDAGAAQESLRQLVAQGMPNAFGEQRFGRSGDNAARGKTLIQGSKLPSKPDRFQRRLYLSAYQSQLFNAALTERLRNGTFARALLGDVLKKHETGGEFVCTDPAVDQPRVEAFEVSPAGPIFGPHMTASAGEVAQAEARLLSVERIAASDWERGRGETEGARRLYRVRLEAPEVEVDGGDLLLRFTLPRGSYATVAVRELLKSDALPELGGADD